MRIDTEKGEQGDIGFNFFKYLKKLITRGHDFGSHVE